MQIYPHMMYLFGMVAKDNAIGYVIDLYMVWEAQKGTSYRDYIHDTLWPQWRSTIEVNELQVAIPFRKPETKGN